MRSDSSPLRRSIGLTGVIRWFIALALAIACGAAASEGRWGMAGTLAVFAVGAAVLSYRARRGARIRLATLAY